MEYVVKITWEDVIKTQSTAIKETKSQTELASKPEREMPKNQSNDALATLRRTATIYAFADQGASFGVNYFANQYSIQGESLKAERLQTTFNNTKKYTQTGLGIALSVATGNPLVVAMTAYSLANQAIQLGLETQRYVAQLSLEKQRSAYYSERLARNISEVR